MRRDAALSTSLRTGYISRDAVSDGLRNRFFALLRMTFLVTIDAAADGVKDLKEDSLSI